MPLHVPMCLYWHLGSFVTKILSNQHQTVLSALVGDHQAFGIRGRTIQTNTHIARCVLDCCLMDGDGVVMLQIKFETALDQIRHDILFCISEHVGIKNANSREVRLAYSSCVIKLNYLL